jgi:hypothetical protein
MMCKWIFWKLNVDHIVIPKRLQNLSLYSSKSRSISKSGVISSDLVSVHPSMHTGETKDQKNELGQQMSMQLM